MNEWTETNKPPLGVLDSINALKFADNSRKPSALDIFRYINEQPDKTATGKQLSEHFDVDVGAVNVEIVRFGKEVSKHLHIPDQVRPTGERRYWNIPFMNDRDTQELNNSNFHWTLRPEFVRALEAID